MLSLLTVAQARGLTEGSLERSLPVEAESKRVNGADMAESPSKCPKGDMPPVSCRPFRPSALPNSLSLYLFRSLLHAGQEGEAFCIPDPLAQRGQSARPTGSIHSLDGSVHSLSRPYSTTSSKSQIVTTILECPPTISTRRGGMGSGCKQNHYLQKPGKLRRILSRISSLRHQLTFLIHRTGLSNNISQDPRPP
jgi:hypothetical protein